MDGLIDKFQPRSLYFPFLNPGHRSRTHASRVIGVGRICFSSLVSVVDMTLTL